MCTDYIKSYNELQQELENAKDTLVVLNDNIKRIIGRGPKLPRDSRPTEIQRCDNDITVKTFQQESSKSKKRTNDSKSVFKRLSSPSTYHNEAESKPKLTSRVIRELPSRQEIVAAQCVDSESRARNRRMFGSLLGTLHKFCQEESRLRQKEEKKAQIEKKLEEQEIMEREALKREREILFVDRKRKQMEIKRLESKISRIKDYETWESSVKCLKTFIKTKTSPSIYYRPKILTKKTDKLLAESLHNISSNINIKKEDLKFNLIKLEGHLQFPEYNISEDTNITFDNIANEFDSSSVVHNTLASSICVIKDTKCDPNSKENKFRNTGEPALCSSVVVINH